MSIHSRMINGALAFYDTHRCRVVDAIGYGVNKWNLDTKHISTDGTTTLNGYTVTVVSAGAGDSIAVGTAVPGNLVVTTAATENDGFSIQLKGEGFKLVASKPCYFGCKVKLDDVTQSDLLVGLCITDTTLLGGMTDGVYFRKVDGAATCDLVLEKDSTETTGTIVTMVNDTFVILEFFFDGTYVDSYVNGTLQTRLAITNLCQDEELTPSIEVLTGEGVSKVLTIEWARAFQFN